MFACAKQEDSSTETQDSSDSGNSDDSSDEVITEKVNGYIQKGPFVQGTEVTMRTLRYDLAPTGQTYTGTIEDNSGSFVVRGTIRNRYAELSADGYYFNEVSGALSTSKLTLQALVNLKNASSVNVNLMTHLEKKRFEYLMDKGVSFSEAKSQAQSEIVKMFNIDNVILGNSETLDISKSGDDNAVLLAISVILQSNRTEAELTELLSTINTDIRADGLLNSSSTKQKLVDGLEHIKPQITSTRTKIKNRYDDLGLVSNIPSFESYVLKLDTEVPTISSTSHSDNTSKIAVNLPITVNFSDYMDNNSISSSEIYLTDNLSNLIPGSLTYLDNKSLTLTPDNNLSENATYIGFVKAGIKDLAGNQLESDYSWTFKTGDFTAPIISEVTPIKTNGNDPTPDVVISASEPGTLTFGGDCSSSTINVFSGNNTLTLNSLSDGTYSNCTRY